MGAKEISPGVIEVTCDDYDEQITRANEFGMFCDAEICHCEIASKAVAPQINNMIKQMAKMFENGDMS